MHKTLLFDGHVHIYPMFDIVHAVQTALQNFEMCQSIPQKQPVAKIWLLTERSDCHFFEDLKELELDGYVIQKTLEDAALLVRDIEKDLPQLYIFAGRQLIARENLEICALGSTINVADKELSAKDLILKVLENNGMPALNWAPGKWFGDRGKMVRSLLQEFKPKNLLISDTTMRPNVWPTPKIMAEAMQRGYKVIAGSDPLPFAGEENFLASYASIISGEFDDYRPIESFRSLLFDRMIPVTRCGTRSELFTFMKRQIRIMREKNVK
ncbi:MAG: hypothetical protein GWP06_00755 [Actinobacteria bacterium]|nr:hypothetical protein [Actinomycetota bacterium]